MVSEMLVVVATILLIAADDGAMQMCSSDKEGDSTTESCFGWCSSMQATDHCQWCKVRWPRRSREAPI